MKDIVALKRQVRALQIVIIVLICSLVLIAAKPGIQDEIVVRKIRVVSDDDRETVIEPGIITFDGGGIITINGPGRITIDGPGSIHVGAKTEMPIVIGPGHINLEAGFKTVIRPGGISLEYGSREGPRRVHHVTSFDVEGATFTRQEGTTEESLILRPSMLLLHGEGDSTLSLTRESLSVSTGRTGEGVFLSGKNPLVWVKEGNKETRIEARYPMR